MINSATILEYNKTRAFARKKYKPWDATEIAALEESAPLLKFTLEKQAKAIQAQNIKCILDLAKSLGIKNVIISGNTIQFFNDQRDHHTISKTAVVNAFDSICKCIKFTTTQEGRNLIKITVGFTYYHQFDPLLMEGSRERGLYVLKDDQYAFVQKSQDIMQHIWDLNYVAHATRTPSVVGENEFGMKDVEEIRLILDFFKANNLSSVWSSKFIRHLYAKTQKNRFPGYLEFHKLVRKYYR
jgi:hypothetical protein